MTNTTETAKIVDFKVEKDLTTLNIEGTKFTVTPNSDVTVYLKEGEGVQTKPADESVTAADAADPSVRISPEFNAASAYGAHLQVTADGPVISTNGKVNIKPAAPPVVEVAAAVVAETPAVAAPNAPLKVGDAAEDGWIYLGKSPTSRKDMFVAPQDAGEMEWPDANRAAKAAHRQWKTDARIPTDKELKFMFKQKAHISGLNEDSLYWSSSIVRDFGGAAARVIRFSDGDTTNAPTILRLPTRLVRS